MTRHWSARLLGATLALAFGLAMAGPEMHQCPVHDQHTSPAAHHQTQSPDHQDGPQKHCTCPQACCPVGVGVALLPGVAPSITAAAAVQTPILAAHTTNVARAPRYLLPFALAPPHPLV
jgi:hypothetical protein